MKYPVRTLGGGGYLQINYYLYYARWSVHFCAQPSLDLNLRQANQIQERVDELLRIVREVDKTLSPLTKFSYGPMVS